MSSGGQRKLDELANRLAAQGADSFRVETLHRARRFKRSWIEMAEALSEIKRRRSYEAWGFADLHAYCSQELLLKRATVEKLTGSYRTLEKHAPELLADDGDDARLPTLDAVDYFARAVGERKNGPTAEAPPEVIERLRDAVFDEARPMAALRREFHAELYPRNDNEAAAERAERTRAQVRRLIDALPTIEGLGESTVRDTTAALEALERELTALASPLDASTAESLPA